MRMPIAVTIVTLLITLPLHAQAKKSVTGGAAASMEQLFNLLDKDKDGKISKQEAAGSQYEQRFSQWDADGDGVATRQEIHDYRSKLGIDDAGQRTNGKGKAKGNSGGGGGRPEAKAVIVKEPTDWRLENLPVPPGFAQEIKLKGTEEARFSPGMYDTTSPEHLTYLFSILADDAPMIDAAGLKDFLEKYFRGLSVGVGQRKGFKIEPEQMIATVTPGDTAGRFKGQMVFYDSFTDGKKVTLNLEMQVIACAAVKKTCLIFLISPTAMDSPQWKKLRDIGAKAAANAEQLK